MKRVLFLCAGNSCRSQMAEVILNSAGAPDFTAVSAGAKPAGYVHPLAVKVLQAAGLPTEGLRSKSWQEYESRPFDYVITVCDRAKESCPIFPGGSVRLHWGFPDPAEAMGTETEKREVFDKVFKEIRARIAAFLAEQKTVKRS